MLAAALHTQVAWPCGQSIYRSLVHFIWPGRLVLAWQSQGVYSATPLHLLGPVSAVRSMTTSVSSTLCPAGATLCPSCTRRGRCGARLVLGESSSQSHHADVPSTTTRRSYQACMHSLEGCMHHAWQHGPGQAHAELRCAMMRSLLPDKIAANNNAANCRSVPAV